MSVFVTVHEDVDALFPDLLAVLLLVIDRQRTLTNHHRLMGVADRQPNPDKQARVEQMVFIVESGPELERAPVVIDPVVGEVDDAFVRKLVVGFIGKADVDGNSS